MTLQRLSKLSISLKTARLRRMFERQFRRFELESKDPIARTLKAIQESTEALILFNEPAA